MKSKLGNGVSWKPRSFIVVYEGNTPQTPSILHRPTKRGRARRKNLNLWRRRRRKSKEGWKRKIKPR